METFTLILGLLGAGLKLWESKERRKYIDKTLDLEKKYFEESKKPFKEQDHAKLDNIEFELKILAKAFIRESMEKK